MRILLLALAALCVSCGQSTSGQSKQQVAQSLGVDVKKLDSKTFYSFTIQDGEIGGKTFMTPSYVQTSNGFSYGGDSKLNTTEITFFDPQQGNSTFKISFKNETAQPFASEQGSEFVLSFLNDGKKQILKSQSGDIKMTEFIDNRASFDDPKGSFADERRLELDFEGVFINQETNEEVKIKGYFQFVSN